MNIVIMAGGGGTRLWPKSRIKNPKQLHALMDEKSLIKNTILRLSAVVPKNHIYIATNTDHVKAIKKEVPEIKNMIVEPFVRSTGPCVGHSALYLAQKSDEPVAFLPADHHIENEKEFAKTIILAGEEAKKDQLVLIGIKPTEADTGLGYIKINTKQIRNSKSQISNSQIFKVEKFVEKPDLKTAQKYLRSGQYLWNAGMFVAKPSVILNLFEKHSPEIFSLLEKIKKRPQDLKKEYQKMPNISFDYAVSEKAQDIVVVSGNFTWSDIGNWSKLLEVLSQNVKENVVLGCEHLGVDTEGCLIHGTKRLVATIGLKDVIVVDTPDAVLICHKSQAQNVKKIVEKLKEKNRQRYL